METTAVISIAVAVAGLLFGLVKYRAERRAREEVTRFQERAHAEQVSAWAGKRTEEGRRVSVHNANQQIVRDVKAWLVTPKFPAPPEDALPDRKPTTQRAVLESGDTLEHLIPSSSMPESAPAERPSVILAFRDADGREWMRADDGRLLRRGSAN